MNNLQGRVIQISGSCSGKADPASLVFSHELARYLTLGLLTEGANITTTVDKEDLMRIDSKDLSPIYYWDVLEAAHVYSHSLAFSKETMHRINVVSSEKGEKQIPASRKKIWDELVRNRVVSVTRIRPGWNSGGYRREKQEELSDALITLGGGEGTEHSSQLFISNGKPVLPLDIAVGSSFGDGLGGSSILSRLIMSRPEKYLHKVEHDTCTRLVELKYENWVGKPEECSGAVVSFINDILRPQVFYIRLLNPKHIEFSDVEKFFRNVVDEVVKERRFYIKEMGFSESGEPFINLEIFKEISKSSVIIADLTGLRNNCFMEMGYAFGKGKKVLITAKDTEKIPSDSDNIPRLPWDLNKPLEECKKEFSVFWDKNINRPPLVPKVEVID